MKNMPGGWHRRRAHRRQHGYWDGRAWVEPAAAELEEPEQAATPTARAAVAADDDLTRDSD